MTTGTNGPVCGNCGKGIAPDAITCPHCGVLLAAYQATIGSEALTIVIPQSPDSETPASVTPPVAPITPTPPPPAQPTSRPASSSPIGDALQRAHAEAQADLHRELSFGRSAAADLAAMASGNDDLAEMADGDDELSLMAAGDDELSAMAGTGAGGSFEEAVNAELAGAKVVFAGGTPVIEAAEVEVVAPNEGQPEVIEQPAATPTTPPPPARPQRPAPSERGRANVTTPPTGGANTGSGGQRGRPSGANPARVPAAPSWQSIPGGTPEVVSPDGAKPTLGRAVGPLMAIPFLLIICVILGTGKGVGGFLVFSIITLIIIVFLLVRAARMVTRKTRSMPRDDSWRNRS